MLHRIRRFKQGDILCWRNTQTLKLVDNFTWLEIHGYHKFMMFNPSIVIENKNIKSSFNNGELTLLGLGIQKLTYYMLSEHVMTADIYNRVELFYWD